MCKNSLLIGNECNSYFGAPCSQIRAAQSTHFGSSSLVYIVQSIV